MNCEEALEYIHSIPKFKRPLGNAQLERLLEALGNPQEKLEFIHIAGTNGKGSCAAMTASILENAGYRTGLYTSPFIEKFNERIRVNGECIEDTELAEYTERVKKAMEDSGAYVSEFAFITAAALTYFCEKKCGIVVLEAGMGGRLDATNVIKRSAVSVLMSISLDHTQYLGETIEEIAFEKCGIIKHGGTVVSYPNAGVRDIIISECGKQNAALTFAKEPRVCPGGFVYGGEEYPLSLKGAYQPGNAAVVIEIMNALRKKGYKISLGNIKRGLAETEWQARFEYAADNIIIDGAHNPDGIAALKKSLLMLGRDIVLVTAMMSDKNYVECIRDISGIAKCTVAAELNMPRALSAAEIGAVLEECGAEYRIIPDIGSALAEAARIAGTDGIVCVCGSLYLAGAVKGLINSQII